MKTLFRLPLAPLSFLAGLAFAAAPLSAGPWEPLANGRNLAGWKAVNGTAPYEAVDGAIRGTTTAGSPNSFLATERTFGDFILEGEVLQEGGPSNSGIQFRSLSLPAHENGRVHGYQFEIDPSPRGWSGGIYDEARRGWLYPGTLNPAAEGAYRYGEWNRVRIEAIGPEIRTWINGVPVAHVVDDLTPAGLIALQIHSIGDRPELAGRHVLWRNLRIQTTDLRPSPPDDLFVRNLVPNTISPAERAQGWRLLWDGRTAAGWRASGGGAFPADEWTMADGVLSVLGQQRVDLESDESFSAFELQLEFQLTEGANSGVKYRLTKSAGKGIGLEFQLLDDERHPDAKLGVDGDRTLGSLYDLIPRQPLPPGLGIQPKIGAWQHARIVVRSDGRVEHWLNGVRVVDYRRGSPDFQARVARSKFAGFAGFGLDDSSPVLLQDHGDRVRFRSIKVRELPR